MVVGAHERETTRLVEDGHVLLYSPTVAAAGRPWPPPGAVGVKKHLGDPCTAT